MRIDYSRLLELNREAMTNNGEDQMSSFFIIQQGVERYLLGDPISEQYREFLIDLGILIETEEDQLRRNIVGPFNFSRNGSTNS
jgi:hypothetical protein